MSLAPASSLGAFLKARFAVNGIQWAARSFGTVTAAWRGLLSSMGASSSFGACREKLSASLRDGNANGLLYFRSIERFEGVQGDVQRIDEALEVVGHFDLAFQLPAKRLDQPGTEALPGRRMDRRAAFFGPGQMQPLILVVDGPGDLDASGGPRQRAEFRGIGAEFVECHRQRNHRAGHNFEIGTLNRKLPLALTVIGLGRTMDDVFKVGARPSRLQQEIVRAAQCQKPALDGALAVFDAACGAQAL